jgi:hypothetical protein
MNITDLMKCYTRLSLLSNILDMREYALDWRRLMASAQRAGFRSLARNARSRWRHYRRYIPGEYVRLVDPPFAELIPVELQS